jgi:hypothetical protein
MMDEVRTLIKFLLACCNLDEEAATSRMHYDVPRPQLDKVLKVESAKQYERQAEHKECRNLLLRQLAVRAGHPVSCFGC